MESKNKISENTKIINGNCEFCEICECELSEDESYGHLVLDNCMPMYFCSQKCAMDSLSGWICEDIQDRVSPNLRPLANKLLFVLGELRKTLDAGICMDRLLDLQSELLER